MRKKLSFVLLSFFLVSSAVFLTSCHKTTSITYVTNYGDTIYFKISERDTMHHEFVLYEISNEKSYDYFYINSESIPNNPLESFEHIVQTNGINIYSLQQHLIFFCDEQVIAINEDFSLENYLAQLRIHQSNPLVIETLKIGFDALCKTNRLRFIGKYDDILIYTENSHIDSLAEKWAQGNISDEDIDVNYKDGYQSADLVYWAQNFQQTKAKITEELAGSTTLTADTAGVIVGSAFVGAVLAHCQQVLLEP